MEIKQPMRLKEWIITLILAFIPVVNIIMLISWALDKENPRNSFSKAYILITGTTISIAFVLFFIVSVAEMGNSTTEEFTPSYEHYDYTNRATDVEVSDVEFFENLIDTSIQAKILNKSDDFTFENITISGLVYDDEGSIIDSFIIFLHQIIPPGETYKFDYMGFPSDAHSIKIDKISHSTE